MLLQWFKLYINVNRNDLHVKYSNYFLIKSNTVERAIVYLFLFF